MSSTTTLRYTSTTGVENDVTDDDLNDIVVEPVASKKLRMSDPEFGLKTAAKLAYERRKREEWQLTRALAISKQRTREQEMRDRTVRDIDADIVKLTTAIMTGTCSDAAKAQETIGKLEARRQKLVTR